MESNQHLWDRFARLGDMIGEGDHDNMAEINREYKKLMLILIPEIKEDLKTARILKNKRLDLQIKEKLNTEFCGKCEGALVQTRSGSLVVKCSVCSTKYKFNKSKK